MEHFYHETRRDRWVRLPYALLTVMLIAGGISYFFDVYNVKPLTAAAQPDQKAAEYVRRRIAEHNAAQAKAATQALTPVSAKTSVTVANSSPAKLATVAKASPTIPSDKRVVSSTNQAVVSSPSRLNRALALLQPVTRFIGRINRKWFLTLLALPLAGFILILRRHRANARIDNYSSDPTALIQVPVESPVAVSRQSDRIFTLYQEQGKTEEEGSLIETYLRPTLANCRESVYGAFLRLTSRGSNGAESMSLLFGGLSPAPAPRTVQTSQAPLSTQSSLFRRAIVTKQ